MIIDMILAIIMDTISSGIAEKKKKRIETEKRNEFEGQIKEWLAEFCSKYDDTIATSSNFIRFVKHYHPIENIYEYVRSYNNDKPLEQDFISGLKQCYKKQVLGEETMPLADEKILDEFLVTILRKYIDFLATGLNDAQKVEVHMINEQLGAKIERAEQKIIDGCIAVLEKSNQEKKKLDEETKEKIYFSIVDILWEGDIEKAATVLKVIEKEEEELTKALTLNWYLVVGEENSLDRFDARGLSTISNTKIKADIIRRLIIFNIKNPEMLEELRESTDEFPQIKRIIIDLQKKDYQRILCEKREVENGIKRIVIKIQDYYDQEEWLVKRIMLYYLLDIESQGIYQSLEILLDNKNIIEQIMVWKKKAEELIQRFHSNGGISNIAELYEELIERLDQCQNIKIEYKKIYFFTLLRCSYIVWINFEKTMSLVPQELKKNIEIRALLYSYQIKQKIVNESELISFCRTNENFRLIFHYLVEIVKEPIKIVEFLDENKYMLSENIDLLLLYCQFIEENSQYEIDINDVLDKYKEDYENNLEYLIKKVHTTGDETILHDILQKIKEDILQVTYAETYSILIKLCIGYKLYDEGMEIIRAVEVFKIMTPSICKDKAVILLAQEKRNEALQVLIEVSDLCKDDPVVLSNILMLSVINRREIPYDIIECAKKSEFSEVLLWVALDYHRKNDREQSQLYITKALIRCNADDVNVFAKYLMIHLEAGDGSLRKTKSIEQETAVYLRDDKTEKNIVYCIHKNNMLSEKCYEWEDAIHIEITGAATIGLVRKKKGDVVRIGSDSYTVQTILPLECFLFRVCLKKMVEQGGGKAVNLEMKNESVSNIDEVNNILKNENNVSNTADWLEDYRKTENIPPTLFEGFQSTSLTYEEFVCSVFKEKEIIVRNLFCNISAPQKGYILSATAMLLMYHIGVPTSLLNENHVSIPSSLLRLAKDEAVAVYNKNNKDTVATLGVIDGQMFFNETREEEKTYWIQESAKIQEYVKELTLLENYRDIEMKDIDRGSIINVFGICDYDAIALANKEKMQIITFEPMMLHLSSIEGSDIFGIDILSFIIDIKCAANDVIKYMKKMVEFRVLNILNEDVFKYIINEYTDSSGVEKEMIGKTWGSLLELIDTTEKEYKDYFVKLGVYILREIDQYQDAINNYIIVLLMRYVFDGMGYSFEWSYNHEHREFEISINQNNCEN